MKKYLIVVLMFICSLTKGQQSTTAFLYTHNKGLVHGKQRVELKWFTQNVQTFGGVTLYRQQEGSSEWVKLNEEPVTMQASISDTYKKQDKNLEYFEEIARQQRSNPAKVNGILMLTIWVKAFESKPYAQFLGIYYEDSTAQTGSTYRYKAVLSTRIKTSELAISETIKAEEKETITDKLKDIRLKAGRRKVDFFWKEESTRFWAVNVYRRKSGEKEFKLVNKNPIMTSTSTDENGANALSEKMYEDDSLQENTLYEYQLTALDFFGQEGEYSGVYPVYIKDRTCPGRPKLEIDSISKMKVWLKWDLVMEADLKGYSIYRSKKSDGPYELLTDQPIPKASVVYYDELKDPADYYYFVSAIDTSGNESPSEKVIANIADVQPPRMPEGLAIKADTGVILLSWKVNLEKDLWGYYIYRGLDPVNPKTMSLLNTNPVKNAFFNDTINKLAKNRFYYRIAAVDTNYNISALTNAIGAAMPDIIPPDRPFIRNVYADDNIILIEWSPNAEKDLMGYTLYEQKEGNVEVIKINLALISYSSHSYQYEIKDTEDKQYKFSLSATDSTGNESEISEFYSYYYRAPVKPVGVKEHLMLHAKSSKDNKVVELKWKYIGNREIKGFVVYSTIGSTGEPMALSGLIDKTSFKDRVSQNTESKYEVRLYFKDGSILKSGYKIIDKQ